MRIIIWALAPLLVMGCAISQPSSVTRTYLALDLPFAPFEKRRLEVETLKKIQLKHRGEAHITVLTPPEFKKMQDKLSMREIDALASKLELQKASFKPLCIGSGQVSSSGLKEATYYVVVESPELLHIREEIQRLYLSKGGRKDNFSPLPFYPHVTLGFTQRDLHLEDGVIKDAKSCILPLEEQK